MTVDRFVTGDAQAMRVFARLKHRTPAVVAEAMAMAGPAITKTVQSSVRVPSVRRTIGWRFVAQNAEEVEAKIGAAVGGGASSRVSGQRGNRPGVGIDSRNVHWWFQGTKFRKTEKGRRTGFMPAQSEPISVLVERAGGLYVLRHFISQKLVHEFEVAK